MFSSNKQSVLVTTSQPKVSVAFESFEKERFSKTDFNMLCKVDTCMEFFGSVDAFINFYAQIFRSCILLKFRSICDQFDKVYVLKRAMRSRSHGSSDFQFA